MDKRRDAIDDDHTTRAARGYSAAVAGVALMLKCAGETKMTFVYSYVLFVVVFFVCQCAADIVVVCTLCCLGFYDRKRQRMRSTSARALRLAWNRGGGHRLMMMMIGAPQRERNAQRSQFIDGNICAWKCVCVCGWISGLPAFYASIYSWYCGGAIVRYIWKVQ